MKPAVFLDRDGVLNRAIVREGRPHPPGTLEDMELLEEARIACRRLRTAGFALICVTNQPDVARGKANLEDVDRMNRLVKDELQIDAIYVCSHDDQDNCRCRKPLPGLMFMAAEDHTIDLSKSYLVGDRWRDIDAGIAAGCKTVFIQRGYKERQPVSPTHTVLDTDAAARWIILDAGIE